MKDKIRIKGAREHNLKNVSLEIPRDKLVVFTGLSGSGKSSLAFDTIFAEGQRRYIESLSSYARQFLSKIDKPDVDEIEGLSPSISIDQKSHSSNPRSTVATITEIYDYLRVLFARLGSPHCPECGHEIKKLTKEEIVDLAIALFKEHENKGSYLVLAPIVRGRKGEHYQKLYDLLNSGFFEVRVDGTFHSLRERIELSKNKAHNIDLVVDRLPSVIDYTESDNRTRLAEAVESALKYGNDVVTFIVGGKEVSFSAKFTCPNDGTSFPEIEPRLFSFNSPFGCCETCGGLGTEAAFSEKVCPACRGARLRPAALSVLISGKNIAEVVALSVIDARNFFDSYGLALLKDFDAKKSSQWLVAENILKEITNRLRFLFDVGLDYLSLDRRSGTLSGGEAQRIRLASQIGSHLVGTLYILDEPTIGLHQRDNEKLIDTLKRLRDLGNTVIVVEHDEDTIHAADFLVDVGPEAGVRGGEVVAIGALPDILKDKKQKSLTLDFLRGERKIEVPDERRRVMKDMPYLTLKNVHENNLKNIDVKIPLGRFVALTGVSGSGKSTLLYDVLYKDLANRFNGADYKVGAHDKIFGTEYVNRVVSVDQSAIGRTPRSNPATYVGAWTYIRELFASTPDAKVRGYGPGRFSFNVPGGRCENCGGYGYLEIEMHFLPAVEVECEVCRGKRFDRETLAVEYQDKNIYDILQMPIGEAAEFFKEIPWVADRLRVLNEVGLDYLKLGQSATTLSGGEAQRVKLAAELGKRDTRRTLYLLDEPTTGLHFKDVERLLEVLNRLVDRGNSVVLIEHNLDVIKTADWIIDLGPDGGVKGGEIVAEGTPEEIARKATSTTGKYLKKLL